MRLNYCNQYKELCFDRNNWQFQKNTDGMSGINVFKDGSSEFDDASRLSEITIAE